MNKNKTIPLILIIIIAVGFIWYLVNSKNTIVKTVNEETPTSTASSTATTSTTSITYTNNELGFTFNLPDTWTGYSIVSNSWEGNPLTATATKQTGPKLLIRNPKWTEAIKYEDIPVLVFTLAQWDSYQAENFAVAAAPIKASEIGRNNLYVFALPPRWDFDYSQGFEEAQNIVRSNPLKTFEVKRSI